MARNIKTRSVRTINKSEGYKAPSVIELNPDNFHDGIDFVMAFSRVRRDGKLPFVRLELNKEEEGFLKLVTRGGLVPVFKGKGSNNIFLKRPEEISNGDFNRQFSDTYFMPVLYKSTELSRSSKVKYVDSNDNKIEKEVSFMSTAKRNILAINEVMLDIDIRQNIEGQEVSYDEGMYKRISESILYFACEDNLPLPTAIVATGRGLQLHFVAKDPIYLNSKKAENLIDFTRDKLKEAYNSVLSNITVEGSGPIICDDATGSFSQKMRLPGSVNLKSGTRARLIHFSEERVYIFSDILNDLVGEREEKVKVNVIKNKRMLNKKLSPAQMCSYNQNLRDTQIKRMKDISEALILKARAGEEVGYRNNAYWAMATVGVMANLSYEEIRKRLLETDAKLNKPYFTSEKKMRSLISYARENSPEKLSNKSIEKKVLCVEEALNKGQSFSTLGTIVREDIRKEKKNTNLNNKVLLVRDLIENNKSVAELEKIHPFKKSAIYTYKKIVDAIGHAKNFTKKVTSRVIRACEALEIKKIDEWIGIVEAAIKLISSNEITSEAVIKGVIPKATKATMILESIKEKVGRAVQMEKDVLVGLADMLAPQTTMHPAFAGAYTIPMETLDGAQSTKGRKQLSNFYAYHNDGDFDDEEYLRAEDLHGSSIIEQEIAEERHIDGSSREEFTVALLEGIDAEAIGEEQVQELVASLLNPFSKKENCWWKGEDPLKLDSTGVVDLGAIDPDSLEKF